MTIKDPQREIIKAIITELNTDSSFLYREGYLIYEGENVDEYGIKQNKFSFFKSDPDNKFALIEQEYIPTSFSGFLGSVEPITAVYDETSNLNVQFALIADSDFVNKYQELEELKRNLAGKFGTYTEDTTVFNYVLSTKTISQDQAPIELDGNKVVIINVPIAYRVFDARAGNANSYRIKGLNDSDDDYVSLPIMTRNINMGSDIDPTAPFGEAQTTWNKKSTIFKMNMSIYDTDNTFTDYLYTIIADDTVKSDKVHTLEMTLNGTAYTRNVILEGISFQDSIGTPVTWQYDLLPASQILINKQIAPIVTGVEDGITYITNVTPIFQGTGTMDIDGAGATSFTSGTEITVNGSYVLLVTGSNGVQVTINFIVAKP